MTEDDAITKHLIQRNSNHLSLSGESPFTRGKLADTIGKDDEGTVVDELLHGTFERDLSGMEETTASSEMTNFLKALQIPISHKTGKPVKEMGDNVSLQEYKEAYNRTKEATSSSPSGVHYRHYIASCECEMLSKINLVFMTAPFRTGMSLTRRTRSLHCMIQKKSLSYINKLGIVLIYEADFNTMLNIMMGRRLMKHEEEHGLNGHQLYGSRKGKSTYGALITVRILYNLARVQRDYIILMLNDLM